jgi:hypothetical protein
VRTSQLTAAALQWLQDSKNAQSVDEMFSLLQSTADTVTYDSFLEAVLTLKEVEV